jgi:uncharacterized LabA/DUF88 family protein
MQDRTYVFIDGEYVRQRHRDAMRAFFGVDGELELSPIMQQARANRAYFYDAIDDTAREGESDDQRKVRVRPLEQFFAQVQSLRGFHVRPGSVRRGKRREQKEVDVLLAADMLEHGFNGSMGKAVLIAGDLDFRPVVEALVRHGVFVEVWYHPDGFAEELPGAADFGHSLRFSELHSWNTKGFKATHRIPREDPRNGEAYGHLVRVGSVWGNPAELRRYAVPSAPAGETFCLWITNEPGWFQCVWDDDRDLIERYVGVQYGPIEWHGPDLPRL